MSKHAYLIIAHNNFYILEKLLKIIDDPRNDIYIHIDQKVNNIDFDYYKSLMKYSKIEFIPRLNVGWGGFSQIQVELNLFQHAIRNKYQYYHLLSGVDMPLKTQDYIHKFFDDHDGIEFLTYLKPDFMQKQKINERVSTYYVFQELGRNKPLINCLSDLTTRIQRIFKIDRYKSNLPICYGANWASLTHDAVREILKNKKWIYNTFKFTRCGDEIYKQTILVNNSYFINKLYFKEYNEAHISYNMRYVDWKRGSPYIFKESDFDELINSYSLFARKFDENIDKNIVDKLYHHLCKN